MAKLGLRAAAAFHDSNTGSLPYTPLKLNKSGDRVMVRVLWEAGTKLDENQQPIILEGHKYIPSLYFHSKFQVLNERCLVDDDVADPNVCALCRVQAPRSMKTFIPVRVRGDAAKDSVKWFVVGKEVLQAFISACEVIPDNDITIVDFVIMREGEKLQTRYQLYPQNDTKRPLNEQEKALEVPDPETFYPMKTAEEIEGVALTYERATKVTATGGGNGVTEHEEVPF